MLFNLHFLAERLDEFEIKVNVNLFIRLQLNINQREKYSNQFLRLLSKNYYLYDCASDIPSMTMIFWELN